MQLTKDNQHSFLKKKDRMKWKGLGIIWRGYWFQKLEK